MWGQVSITLVFILCMPLSHYFWAPIDLLFISPCNYIILVLCVIGLVYGAFGKGKNASEVHEVSVFIKSFPNV